MKYDERHPDKRMYKRALLSAAVFMLVCLRSWAQQAPWHAEAVPSRSSLPSVSVDLGYPGPYVPWRSAPITLHATAAGYPFDGYIGFHFRVKDHRTYDAPVIARAVLKPHESWTFTTYAHLIRGDQSDRNGDKILRELTVEWHDAARNLIAFHSVGVPPWTGLQEPTIPLRIDANPSVAGQAFGATAYATAPQALPDNARWYAGFSSVVISTETWLDLPARVREAIFGSGIPMVFFGLPRAKQQLTEIDRAILPVSFTSQPGTCVVPQPYGASTAQAAMPMSWSAKPSADRVGAGSMPYMVRTLAATWMANDAGLAFPLPLTRRDDVALVKAERAVTPIEQRPCLLNLLREFRSAVCVVIGLLLAIAGWLVLRRQPRVAAIALLLLVACGSLLVRNRIRPASEERHSLSVAWIDPGLVSVARVIDTYGPSPVPAAVFDPEVLRTSLTGAAEGWGRTEERTSQTEMSMGSFSAPRDWDGMRRWTKRREVTTDDPVHVRAADRNHFEIDYHASFPVRAVLANWVCGNVVCGGGLNLSGDRKGTVTIENGRSPWTKFYPLYFAELNRYRRPRVVLVGDDDLIDWFDAQQPPPGSFAIQGRLPIDAEPTRVFALPSTMHGDETALVTISRTWAVQEVSVATGKGWTVLQPATRAGLMDDSRSWSIPNDLLHQLLADGGVVNVRVQATRPQSAPAFNDIMIEIWENKR